MLIRITSWIFNLTGFAIYVAALKYMIYGDGPNSWITIVVPLLLFVLGGIILFYSHRTRFLVEHYYENKKKGYQHFLPIRIPIGLNWFFAIVVLLFFGLTLIWCLFMLYVMFYDPIRPLIFLGVMGTILSLAPIHCCIWNIRALIFLNKNKRGIGHHDQPKEFEND